MEKELFQRSELAQDWLLNSGGKTAEKAFEAFDNMKEKRLVHYTEGQSKIVDVRRNDESEIVYIISAFAINIE